MGIFESLIVDLTWKPYESRWHLGCQHELNLVDESWRINPTEDEMEIIYFVYKN